MNIYRIADLNIGITPKSEYSEDFLSQYRVDADSCDFIVEISDTMLEYEKRVLGYKENVHNYELIAILREICRVILERYNGFFLHCSCLALDGKAYVFTAPSGTGKSTHTALWRKEFQDSVVMINDDKPIVRLIDGVFYIYGTPWKGKHGIGNNIKAPIEAIYFLRQSKVNRTTRVSGVSALSKILAQTVIPRDRDNMNRLLDMIELLLNKTPTFLLDCTISREAVHSAYYAVKGTSYET